MSKKTKPPTTRTFAAPANPNGPDLNDLLGHDVLITPSEVRTGVKTKFGGTTVVVARLVDLDTGHAWFGWHVFPTVLVKQLQGKVGEDVLGTLTQGEAGSSGQNPPWIIEDATGNKAAIKKANAWLDADTNPTPTTATTPPPPSGTLTPEIQALLAALGATPRP